MPVAIDVSWSINNVERIEKTWIKSEKSTVNTSMNL